MSRHKLEASVFELNQRAAQIARAVADAAGRAVVVAGSVGPTGDLLAPLGPLRVEDAEAMFVDQIDGLKAGGVDVIWIETMWAPEEIRAAAKAAARRDDALLRHRELQRRRQDDAWASRRRRLRRSPLRSIRRRSLSARIAALALTDLMFSALRMTGRGAAGQGDRQSQCRPAAMAGREPCTMTARRI